MLHFLKYRPNLPLFAFLRTKLNFCKIDKTENSNVFIKNRVKMNVQGRKKVNFRSPGNSKFS